jgi:hypothetical protein
MSREGLVSSWSPCAEFGNGGVIPASCLRGPFFGASFLMCASNRCANSTK